MEACVRANLDDMHSMLAELESTSAGSAVALLPCQSRIERSILEPPAQGSASLQVRMPTRGNIGQEIDLQIGLSNGAFGRRWKGGLGRSHHQRQHSPRFRLPRECGRIWGERLGIPCSSRVGRWARSSLVDVKAGLHAKWNPIVIHGFSLFCCGYL